MIYFYPVEPSVTKYAMEKNNIPYEKLITSEDARNAKAGKIKLKGRMTAEALKEFLVIRGDCNFSEVMAEGTDSWINAATVDLDLNGVDLSGVTNLEEAKMLLKSSLDKYAIGDLISVKQRANMLVNLEERYIKICF